MQLKRLIDFRYKKIKTIYVCIPPKYTLPRASSLFAHSREYATKTRI